MRLPICDAPPDLHVSVNYRELYDHGAFAQRELVGSSDLSSQARERELASWIGQDDPESVDRKGALCPIAFSLGNYAQGFELPPVESEYMVFREETEYAPWETYAWDAWGHPEVTALYSLWQLLYLDAVVREGHVALPLGLLLGEAKPLAEAIARLKDLLERQQALLADIDCAWRPLIKLLVCAQNVYWPRVRGRINLRSTVKDGYVDSGETQEDPAALLNRAGCDVSDLIQAYEFLVERGLRRDPQDGLTGLRRAVPREYHKRWAGPARLAQDHFDAAQILYLWISDLQGAPPRPPTSTLADGRYVERMALYERGPSPTFVPQEIKAELIATELFPAGPIVIGEGKTEGIVIDLLAQFFLRRRGQFTFHDLGGSGSAAQLRRLLGTLQPYAPQLYLVVDNEGEMATYVAELLADGRLQAKHLLLADDSFEHDNFTPQELIDAVAELGRNPPDEGRNIAELRLTAEQLEAEHTRRRDERPRSPPGIAETLLKMARRDEHGSVNVSKRELARTLAVLIAQEIYDARGAEEQIADIKRRRPIAALVIEQLCPALAPPRPANGMFN